MNRIIRLILLGLSLILFLIITPFVVLYAIGYRVGPSQITPTPIGVLLLDTVPRRANVIVNGEHVGRTPRAVSNLAPGDVSLRLELPGYYAWEKNVHIEPTLTSEFRSVRLFPRELNTEELSARSSSFAVSPNKQLIAVVHDNTSLEVIDRSGKVVVPAQEISFMPDHLLWSSDNASLLLHAGNKASVLSLADQTIHQLRVADATENTFVWDPRLPNRLLYLSTKNQLIMMPIETGQKSILVSNVSSFAAVEAGIVAAHPTGVVAMYDFSGQEIRTLASRIGDTVSSIQVNQYEDIILLLENQTALLLQGDEEIEIARGVSQADWSPDGLLVLVKIGSSEIHVFNADNDRLPFIPKGELQLVSRLSQPIRSLFWFVDSQHVVYQINDEIIISEIDVRDHPITYRLDTTDLGDPMPALDDIGETMYYNKRSNDTTSLMATSLVVE